MQKWEYLRFRLKGDHFEVTSPQGVLSIAPKDEVLVFLNNLGSEGWELASVVSEQGYNHVYICKRAKEENSLL
jgi:hypothetical protein